jgi:hypothetical protein
MDIKKTVVLLLLSVLLLIPVSACGSSGYTATELIPQKAGLILNIQINDIVGDTDIRDAYDKSEKDPDQPQTVEEGMDELLAETGIRLSDFSQAVLFADISGMDYSSYMGFIVEGDFEEKQFIENIEEKTDSEFSSSEYQGYTLYANPYEELVITFLDDKTLLAGTEDAVKDVIAVAEGDRKPVSGDVVDTYNNLGDALIKMAVRLPEEAREAMSDDTGMGYMPFSLDSFSDIDIIGFALNKKNETLNARIDTYFSNADSAQDAKDTINGFISLFKGTLEDQETKDLLGDIEFTVSGSMMTIEFDISLPEIENLMETF